MSKKKRIIIIVSILLFVIIAAVASLIIIKNLKNETHDDSNTDIKADNIDNKEKISIKPAETKTIEYEDYNNSLISLKIPKGWKVEVAPADYIHYTFKVYNPDNPNYMFLYSLKLEGFLKSEKARSTFAKLYPDSAFAKITPIDPQTTEAFYKVWNPNAKYSNEVQNNTFLPYLNDFTVIENLGKTSLGGDIIRASFKNDNKEEMQGLFTATVYDPGPYNMYGVDLAPLNVYHIVMLMSPDEDFNNWMEIMDYCIGTLEFSQSFISGFNSQETTIVNTVKANQKIYDEISDMIMDSWEKRNNSYDIISQKRSDATLGYERVYNTETGEIYKAYNGFTDNYSGTKYEAITENMYTQPIAGYIEK